MVSSNAAEIKNSVLKEKPSDTYINELSQPIVNQGNESFLNNPIVERALQFNPNLSQAEIMAIYNMIGTQLNNSNNGLDIGVYEAYCNMEVYNGNYSNVKPIENIDMSISQLITESPAVSNFCQNMDLILNKYGNMSRNEKVDFLMTHSPSTEDMLKIYDNASFSEMVYLTDETMPMFTDLSDLIRLQDYQGVLKWLNDYNYKIIHSDVYYNLYLQSNESDNNKDFELMIPELDSSIHYLETLDSDFTTLYITLYSLAGAISACAIALFVRLFLLAIWFLPIAIGLTCMAAVLFSLGGDFYHRTVNYVEPILDRLKGIRDNIT